MKLPRTGITILLWWCLVLLLMTSLSCEKEDLPPPQLSAAFQVREVSYNPDFWDVETYDTDSVSTGEVAFLAEEPAADTVLYEWKVGTDSRTFQGRRLELDFSSAPEDPIAVQLTVKRWNKQFTTLLESRSSTRTFYLRRPPLVLGTFEGYFDDFRSQKLVMKIEADFKHPVYYEYYDYSYTGLLVTTNLPMRDTLFVSHSEGRHYIFHRKIPLLDRTIIHFARYQFNQWIEDPYGEIVVDPKTRMMTLNIMAKDITTGKEIPVRFTGKKIN